MERSSKCSKCDASMEKGFKVDLGNANNVHPDRWLPGVPKVAKVFGLTTDWLAVNMREAKLVTTYCCTKCGYLESYAQISE